MNASRKSLRGMFMPALLLIAGCERAPSFNIVGSFFPRVAPLSCGSRFANGRFASAAEPLC
jgi:hypothetical protein